ncbi:hypothetical protein ACTMU2_33635 [Cupriavidus basilensis]
MRRGTNSLLLSGDTQAANVTLAAPTLVNTGTTVAIQQLSASGGTLRNLGMLAGNQVNLTVADLVNRGTLGGQTVKVAAANTLDNAAGLIVGARTLDVTAGALTSNAGGTLFAGDLSGQNPTTGDLTLAVTGGASSFNNANGQIQAGNNVTVSLPNQALDPSAATTGTINANNTVTLAAQSIHNTGTWNAPGANTVLNGAQGISNPGTIQGAGNLILATGGTLDNSGQIVGGSDLSVSGTTITNSGTIHANGDLALAGNAFNSGTTEAMGNMAITGGDYDNRGGTTQAGQRPVHQHRRHAQQHRQRHRRIG